MKRVTEIAQDAVRARLREGDVAVDATAGNGGDTVFLAEVVGATGRVFAFDIQAAAIASAGEKVGAAGLADRVAFVHASHSEISNHVAPGAGAIMFNLGYLPGGDRSVVTRIDTTLAALRASLPLLRPGGILSVVAYPGHPEGAAERDAVAAFFASAPLGRFRPDHFTVQDSARPAPEFFGAVRSLADVC